MGSGRRDEPCHSPDGTVDPTTPVMEGMLLHRVALGLWKASSPPLPLPCTHLEEGAGQPVEGLAVQEIHEQAQDGSGRRCVLQVQRELECGAEALHLGNRED